MHTQDIFGVSATLFTGPDNAVAAVLSQGSRSMVLRSENGRRITRQPLHLGDQAVQQVTAELMRKGFSIANSALFNTLVQQAGFVAAHVRPHLH